VVIVTWNCNGALRKKFEKLSSFNADILIIQECEDPGQTTHDGYKTWAKRYVWKGNNKNRGLGIFVREFIEIEPLKWSSTHNGDDVRHFLPCLIDNWFQLLGVWTSQNNSPNFGYIGQLWKYLALNKKNIRQIIIAGDFNSNSMWDRGSRWWNHSDVVRELSDLNIESLYHAFFKEEQGKESRPTFFLQRKTSKPFHLDYVFASKEIAENMVRLEVADREEWLKLSDHLPVVCNFG
jgi:exonuclease III